MGPKQGSSWLLGSNSPSDHKGAAKQQAKVLPWLILLHARAVFPDPVLVHMQWVLGLNGPQCPYMHGEP